MSLVSSEIGEAGNVVTDAAIRLYDAPEYLFRISESFTGTITLTQGASTATYTVVNGLSDGENVISFRPSGVYAAANTVTVTTEGTVNTTGEYNLGNYREAAIHASLTDVVDVVDALHTYILCAKEYQSIG